MIADLTLLKKKFVPTQVEPPSITQQGWDVQIIDFRNGIKPGVDYFNSALLEVDGQDWLIVRRSELDPSIWVGRNSLMRFSMNGSTPETGWRLKCLEIARDPEHFEDPCVCLHDNHIWIGACNFVWYADRNMWTGAHQTLLKFNKDWNCVARFDPVYGANQNKLSSRLGHEKNWLWFSHESKLHAIYRGNPHTVVAFSNEAEVLSEYITEWDCSAWKWGEIRGGTSPAIGPDGLFWTFFHSSVPMPNTTKRRYVMGAYAFEAKAPFNVVKFTPQPLLMGSKNDKWMKDKPPCVFARGAIFRNGEWLITGGVNDFDTFYARIPHQDLLLRTVDVS